jgi:hypothetical protein
VIWSGGRIRNLGVLPGFYHSYGAGINDRGEAVGTCMGDGSIGFIYRDGVMRPLPSVPGIRHTSASRINNAGDVLAWVYPPGGEDDPAAQYGTCWLYANGEWHDLAPVVARATRWPVQVLHAFDINDHGAIIGVALYPDGKRPLISQGVLLVPQRHAPTESRLPSRDTCIPVGR